MKIPKTLLAAFVIAVATIQVQAKAPRYIFYMIGDGMGPGQVMAAQNYNRMVLQNDQPLTMMQFPVSALCTTYSASSPVTDSAAAGTALATGSKTRNNMLGMDADTMAVYSIADALKKQGYGVALITNVCPDDATPAAFYAHVPARGMYYEIGRQAAESGVDFLAGANLRGTRTKGQYNGLYEEFAKNGMEVTRSMEQARSSKAKRVLLLDTDSTITHTGHAIDKRGNENTLPAVTELAIERMTASHPEGFFMMVEGGNIDWAGHSNDGSTIVKEVLCFDEAIAKVFEFYKQHPDETLIVITADHETGGLSVGQRSVGYNFYPQFVDCQKISKDAFSNWCRELLKSNNEVTWESMQQYLTDNFGFWDKIKISERRENRLKETFEKTFITRDANINHTLYNDFPEFADEIYDIINCAAGFGFTTGNHSGSCVPVFAIGAGSELFGGMDDNTLLPKMILKAVNGK